MIEYTVRVYTNGNKSWFLDGKRHREDGPATEYPDGYKSWHLNGKYMTEEDHKSAMNPAVEMTMEEICKVLGKNVKVIK